jgi:hypothetical protein
LAGRAATALRRAQPPGSARQVGSARPGSNSTA